MKTKKLVPPLLYISQPEFEKGLANMQEDYHAEAGEEITIAKTEKLEINNKPSNSAFKHLLIPEKVTYLTSLPKEIPSIRCEVKTERDTYRGTITLHSETEISVHVLGRGHEIVQLADIRNINLIGF